MREKDERQAAPAGGRGHALRLDNREKLVIMGVEDVDNFNDTQINCVTQAGLLSITGTSLRVSRLSLEEGQLCVEGLIDGMAYSSAHVHEGGSGGFFGRLFR